MVRLAAWRLLWGILGWVVIGLAVPELCAADSASRPNFIIILIDDMGWRDVGFMGNEFVETPNLDRLAKSGLVFLQAYASAPNCAPSRACLMSGQYPPRHGIYTVVDPRQPPGSPWQKLQAAESKSELDPKVVTIAEALQSNGYATGFFGMWNLGRGRTGPVTPAGQGFQKVVFPENLGFKKDAYFNESGEYLSDRLTDEVVAFIKSHSREPFFAYYPDHATHAPFNPKPELKNKYVVKLKGRKDQRDDAIYAATIEAIDTNVGRIVETLKQEHVLENTVVIFTSDNGGTPQYTAPLKGSKGQLYEGGIRVPLLISWAGLKNPGGCCDAPVSNIDFYPTLLEMSHTSSPLGQTQDGVSLVPAMHGAPQLPRERIFWHFPCYVGRATPSSAMREGDWKLIEFFENGGHRELYNLRDDPNEAHDLAAKQPELTAKMYGTLKQWQTETGAAIPTADNSNYDPKARRPRGVQTDSNNGNSSSTPRN